MYNVGWVAALARRHDPDLDLEAIQDHLAGVSVFADEDFAEYGPDEPTIADLRNWVTGWYDDLALRLVADLTDDEIPLTCMAVALWAPAILSVPGATLRVMDTLSNISDTSYEIPLSEADQTALRPALLHDLGAMPFESGALISRSLWVIFIGEWGVWTHAVLPVDDRLDMPDQENITGLCDLVGSLIRPPVCHDDEKAMIALRRPGPAEISEADAYIFRLVRQAVIGRETAPWTFHVVGPDGIREVTEREASQDTAA